MEKALIALIGVLIGILLTEYFRKKNRIETYSQRIFDKRLEVYEKLMVLVQRASDVATAVIEDTDLSKERRHGLVSMAILDIAKYTDTNILYINKYIGVQATSFMMGVEDIQDIEDGSEKKSEITAFYKDYEITKKIIADESGISEVNKHFKGISKSKPKSPMIDSIKKLEKYK